MNHHRWSLAALLLIAISISVVAQRKPPTTPPKTTPTVPTATLAAPEMRIALIDTSAFGDDKEGIIRFRDALKSLEREFKPQETELQSLQTRIAVIAEEIEKLTKAAVVAPESINAKRQEGERLSQERAQKQEKGQKDFERRYREVADPISKDIGNALTKFVEQRGITLTLDSSKLLPAILTISPGVDLTREFIADYNSKNPAPSPAPRQ